MLRITIVETPSEQTWMLQGRLAEPWVAELRSTWEQTPRKDNGRTCVVDLRGVTHVDESGERMLGEMADSGAKLVGCDLYTTHLAEGIEKDSKRRCGFFGRSHSDSTR